MQRSFENRLLICQKNREDALIPARLLLNSKVLLEKQISGKISYRSSKKEVRCNSNLKDELYKILDFHEFLWK